MTYDPAKVEDWVVSSLGFWRKGDVSTDRWHVPFTGTWSQVKARHLAMMAMERRHGDECLALRKQHRLERQTLWPEA